MGKNKNLRFFAYVFFILLVVFLFLTFIFSQNSAYKLVAVARDALRNTVTSSLAMIDLNNVTPQFVRPNTDVSNDWNTLTIWTEIDEVIPDDATTEARTSYLPSSLETFEVGLSDVTDPDVSTGHIYRVRLTSDGTLGATADIFLYQGTTQIASRTGISFIIDNYITYNDTLSAAEADSITDYTDLRIRVTADLSGGGNRVFATWAELEVPGISGTSNDTTPPTVSITSPANGATVSGTITVTAIASDNVGVAGVQFKVDGSNDGVEDTTSPYSVLLNTTELTDGTYTLIVVARDISNNLATSPPITINVDSTISDTIPPTATAICSPSIISIGDPFPCTCSGSDNIAVSSTSGFSTSGSLDTSQAGTFTYTCTVTDTSGNSASATATYTVSGESEETFLFPENNYTWSKITPGAATIMKNFDSEIGLKEIKIEVNNDAQNVKITVTKYDGKPAAVSKAKEGKVYQYLQIAAQNLAEKLEKATVQFRVEKSWIAGNEVNKEDIIVFRFNESASEWEELATNYIGEDNDYSYYIVELESLSYFAISEKSVTTGSEETGETREATGEAQKRNLIWLWVFMALIILILIVALIAIVRHIREKKQQTIYLTNSNY